MKQHIVKTGLTLMLMIAVTGTHAATVANYGDFTADDVFYKQVSENTLSGSYGSPNIGGNTIIFNPTDLDASAAEDSTETNVALLDFDIEAKSGKYIAGIEFAEAGNVTLGGFGFGGVNASADVTAEFLISIYDVDGVSLGTPISDSFSMTFTPSGGTYDLVTDGGGFPYQTSWSGSIYIDLGGMLDSQSVSYIDGATLASLSLTNTLNADSDIGTSALINKNIGSGLSITSDVIPEPTSVALMGTAGLLLCIRRRFIA